MNDQTAQLMLVLILLAVIANLVIAFLNWWRHDGLASRVTRLEAQMSNALSSADCRSIYDRLAHVEGRLLAVSQGVQTIQKHLMETEE